MTNNNKERNGCCQLDGSDFIDCGNCSLHEHCPRDDDETNVVIGLNQNETANQVKITLQEYDGDPWAFLEGTREQFKELWQALGEDFDFTTDGEE